jgi:hypothetical protein
VLCLSTCVGKAFFRAFAWMHARRESQIRVNVSTVVNKGIQSLVEARNRSGNVNGKDCGVYEEND